VQISVAKDLGQLVPFEELPSSDVRNPCMRVYTGDHNPSLLVGRKIPSVREILLKSVAIDSRNAECVEFA